MQDRQQWLEWRKAGIGASDAAVLHGFHEYKTPIELWREKLPETEIKEDSANYVQRKGNNLEPVARTRFAQILSDRLFKDVTMVPATFELEELNFMRASLDCIAKDVGESRFIDPRIGAEVKFLGERRHALVIDEALPIVDFSGGPARVPWQYWIQMQHQYLVSGLAENWFVSIVSEADPLHSVLVPRDDEWIKKHIAICADFWKLVMKRKEPELVDADYKSLRKKGAKGKAKRYEFLDRKIKELETEKEELRKELLGMADHPRMICGNVRLMEIERAGSVDYSKVPELKGVDLEPYRKPSSKSWRIEVKKTSVQDSNS